MAGRTHIYRKSLSGYKVILDLITASHFELPKASELVTFGNEYDLTDHDHFIVSLHDDKERKLVQQVETLAVLPHRRFFHWEIEFPELFFDFADAQHRQIQQKENVLAGSAGFDCIVGNPPYDVLSAKELGPDTQALLDFFRASSRLKDALGRKLNLYRLFIAASLTKLNNRGCLGLIVPLGISGDLSAKSMRQRLSTDRLLTELVAFPQKDDPSRRVFPEAKLSTCILLLSRTPSDSFRLRVYPADTMDGALCDTRLSWPLVKQFDPESLSLPMGTQHTIDILTQVYSDPTVVPLGTVTHCYQGEVNLSTYKQYLTTNSSDADLLKGVEIGRYGRRSEVRQGEKQYFRADDANLTGERSGHHKKKRVVTQGITGVDDRRRLLATRLGPNCFCGHSVNYFVSFGCYSLPAFVVLMNSAIYEWRFRLTSTNNNVNSYEVHALPIPFKNGVAKLLSAGAQNQPVMGA